MRRLFRGERRVFRFVASGVAAVLAAAYFVSPDGVGDRMGDPFLVLLAAAAVIALVPWEHLSSLTAGQFEFVWERPQVAGALRGLSTSRIEDKHLRSLLSELAPKIETVEGSRVLWIDDEPYAILGERRLLRALGIEVVPARSSDEALAELNADNDFDLVITDVQRPGTSYEKVTEGGAVVRKSRRGNHWEIEKADGTRLYDIHEGVNFVVAELVTHPNESIREMPVVFYAAYPMERLVKFTKLIPEALLSNSVDGLLTNVIPALADAREHPIKVPPKKEATGI